MVLAEAVSAVKEPKVDFEDFKKAKRSLYYTILEALHFDPFYDAFPPVRNKALLQALEEARGLPQRERAFGALVELRVI